MAPALEDFAPAHGFARRGLPDGRAAVRWRSSIATRDHDVTLISRPRVFDDFLKIDEGVLQVGDRQLRLLSLERGESAAAVVLRTDDQRVLFTQQFRFPTMEQGPGYMLEVPAGVVEPGEDPATCIRRELVEELGHRATHVEPIASFYASPGGSSERIHLFFAEVDAAGRVSAGGGVASGARTSTSSNTPRASFRRCWPTA